MRRAHLMLAMVSTIVAVSGVLLSIRWLAVVGVAALLVALVMVVLTAPGPGRRR